MGIELIVGKSFLSRDEHGESTSFDFYNYRTILIAPVQPRAHFRFKVRLAVLVEVRAVSRDADDWNAGMACGCVVGVGACACD